MSNKCGIDFSINGTGISCSNGNFYFQTSLKGLPKKINHPNLFADTAEGPSKENFKRYFHNASMMIKFLLDNDVNEIGLEGYAYGYGGSSPGRVFDIAEALGTLKCMLIQNEINICVFAPKQIKKDFTGKGDASKILMVEKYFKLNQDKKNPLQYLVEDFNINKYASPINDCVDAYAILQMV